MPAHKPHFVPRDLQFLTSSTYHRTKLLESDRLLAAELRSAPAGEGGDVNECYCLGEQYSFHAEVESAFD